jgi:hypothetical protein
MTLIPKTPWAEKVLRSAWIPAPPEQSEPAIVRAVFMVNLLNKRGFPKTSVFEKASYPGENCAAINV